MKVIPHSGQVNSCNGCLLHFLHVDR